MPENPRAWLLQVARNRALDVLRREGGLPTKLQLLGNDPMTPAVALADQDEAELVGDDELAMIFMCCHPELSPLTRTTLTLKTVCGDGRLLQTGAGDALFGAGAAVSGTTA